MINKTVYTIICLAIGAGCSPSNHEDTTLYAPDPVLEQDDRRVILFLGDSLTAGYHLDPDDAFPALIRQKLDEQACPYRVVNAGVSGDTSTGGLNRLDWLLREPVDILVLALGANDGLRGQPVAHIRSNLDEIMRRTRARYPESRMVLAGMKMPANYGEPYAGDFERLYAELAVEHDAVLIPFLLEGVAGDPALNLADGIHPTEKGHRVMAEHVWRYLKPLLTRCTEKGAWLRRGVRARRYQERPFAGGAVQHVVSVRASGERSFCAANMSG